MNRLACAALLTTACFSDAPPVDEGAGTDDGSETGDDDGEASTSGSITTAGSSGAEASSSADATDSSDTEPAVCGDGVAEGDEDCDDQNEDEEDGCTIACEAGPRRLTMTMAVPPTAIVPEVGSAVDETCIDDGVPRIVENLHGKVGGPGVGWPLSVAGACDGLELVWNGEAELAIVPDDKMLPQHGDFSGGNDWSIACDPGSVPVGISGRVYDDGGVPPNIRTLRLHCASVQVDRDAPNGVGLTATRPTPWSPGEYTEPEYESMCAPGDVVVGFRGTVDIDVAAVWQLGAECATVVVEFGPEE